MHENTDVSVLTACVSVLQTPTARNSVYMSELVITSGGKNIAPVPIENEIKESVPFLSNVMVVGDHRKYISCLVTLKVGLHYIITTCQSSSIVLFLWGV